MIDSRRTDPVALEWFYAEVHKGDWVCPNGCIAGYFGPWGPGCGTCGWGGDADASRLSHTPEGDPCRWDGLPPLAEPHCGWRDVQPGEELAFHGSAETTFHD